MGTGFGFREVGYRGRTAIPSAGLRSPVIGPCIDQGDRNLQCQKDFAYRWCPGYPASVEYLAVVRQKLHQATRWAIRA